MISCLVGYIGLRTIEDSPLSGLYLNDLPGITTEQYELSRSQEIGAIADEWTALEARAIRGFETDLKYRLRKYYKNHSILSTEVTGYVDTNNLSTHGSGVYSGVLIDLYGQSENLKTTINSVKLNLTGSATFNVKIFDANIGTELFTTSVSGVAGLNTVQILQEYGVYDHNRLFVCYDTVIPYKMYDQPNTWSVYSYKVPSGSTVITDNLSSNDTGMAVNYSVKCGVNEFVCNRLDLFQEAFIYRLALEFLNTSKYSDRFNRFTLLGKDRRDEMMIDFKETYEANISAALQDLKVKDDGICFICNKAINNKVLIP